MVTSDVIVVDDDCLQLHLLVEHCRALGCRSVRSYRSAVDALATLRDSCTAETLLIMDLNMPQMDGVEVLDDLRRAKFPGRVLFISGEGARLLEAATRVAAGMGLKAIGALVKPVGRESLREAVKIRPSIGRSPETRTFSFPAEELTAAMQRNELEVFYQPKVFVGSCEVSGFEALMRWRHPAHGLLTPGSFLPSLEASGLLTAATRYLLRRVLFERSELTTAACQVPIAVNVSICDLERAGFCNELMAILKLHKTHPRDIHLEVTERGVSTNALAALNSMSRLKMQRIKLAVDDFGTGEASLLRLREYPFDYIKIDRCFVHGAATDVDSRAIFDGCSAMAFQLGLGVVAEGVENAEDWSFIRRRNCEQAQGYFIGHPMPARDVRNWMRTWHDRRFGLTDFAA
jgi:EAL domain-containing protein (putative c-di-GMP-specific phosphodiesterase class I)/ActR/RegA family two-component response regulator